MSDEINEDGLNQIKALMGEKFDSLVETYLRSNREHLGKLRQGLESGDAQMIVNSAHPMKSAAGNMGLAGLSASSQELEITAKNVVDGVGEIGDLEALITKIEGQFSSGEAILKA